MKVRPTRMNTPSCRAIKTALLALLCLILPSAKASAQQPITYTPATLQSGSPILFQANLPEATAVTATWLQNTLTFTRSPDHTWYVLTGAGVEQPSGTYPLQLDETLAGGAIRHLTRNIPIGEAHYRTTTIHVEQKFVAPDPATQARIAADQLVKTAAFAHNTPQPLWSGNFTRPVRSSPTDSFGTRRTFNGTLASIHKGADFHAATGTPVYAANDGIVAIAQPMFNEGNFVAIDHGQQLFSLYMHFSRIDVHTGQPIHKGQLLGLSGATGRVTGPHLHFGIRCRDAYLDPVLLLSLPLPGHNSSVASPAHHHRQR